MPKWNYDGQTGVDSRGKSKSDGRGGVSGSNAKGRQTGPESHSAGRSKEGGRSMRSKSVKGMRSKGY